MGNTPSLNKPSCVLLLHPHWDCGNLLQKVVDWSLCHYRGMIPTFIWTLSTQCIQIISFYHYIWQLFQPSECPRLVNIQHSWSAGTSHRKKSDRMKLLWPIAVNFCCIHTHPFLFSSYLPSYLKCFLLSMYRILFSSASSRVHFINYSFSFALCFFN